MRAGPLGFDVAEFGPEDLRIICRDDTIVIAGGAPRGTLYGVYTFLEDYVGVRFLTADHTHVPPIGTWKVIPPVDRFYRPPLGMRWSYYGEINRNPVFAARRRVNTVTRDPKLGGVSGTTNINHSFYRQIFPQFLISRQNSTFRGHAGSLMAWIRQHSMLHNCICTFGRGFIVFGGLRLYQ
jgi:hypothetical protein